MADDGSDFSSLFGGFGGWSPSATSAPSATGAPSANPAVPTPTPPPTPAPAGAAPTPAATAPVAQPGPAGSQPGNGFVQLIQRLFNNNPQNAPNAAGGAAQNPLNAPKINAAPAGAPAAPLSGGGGAAPAAPVATPVAGPAPAPQLAQPPGVAAANPNIINLLQTLLRRGGPMPAAPGGAAGAPVMGLPQMTPQNQPNLAGINPQLLALLGIK